MNTKETLEEAAERLIINATLEDKFIFQEGANWQAKRMYSEEQVIRLLQMYRRDLSSGATPMIGNTTQIWFKQFKKKQP
jgi:hypothetical protein